MKTIFDQSTRDELIARIKTLDENSAPEWGQMNVCQMLRHCILADEMYLGKKTYKRVFLGRLIGRIALNGLLKNEEPMRRNAPTSNEFKIKDNEGDMHAEREKWISVIQEYKNFSNPEFVHWFFGKMTKEQIGYLAYKHNDHHLRQFNS